MANPRYNQQVTNRRGAMVGGRMKKMGGGMTRKMYSKGNPKPDFLDIDGDKNKTEPMKQAAKQAKSSRMMAKKGSIPPQLKKFIEAKQKKKKKKKPGMMMMAMKDKK
jgi:hypothetical protein